MQEKFKSFFRDPSNRFVLGMGAVYLSWRVLYYYLSETDGSAHRVWIQFVDWLSYWYAFATNSFLKKLGEDTVQINNEIHFQLLSGKISVEEHCLAIPAMYIFFFSILLFPGKWSNKLWFIPVGLVGVALINVSRLILLSFIYAHYAGQYFVFHHRFLFVIITYSLIFLLVYIWMRYYSELQRK